MRRSLLLLLAVALVGAGCSGREAEEARGPRLAVLYASALRDEPMRILLRDIRPRGADRLLDVDHSGGWALTRAVWLGSPDGRFVVVADHSKIRAAPASSPLALRRLGGRTTFNDRIGEVVWAPGGTRLFYVEYRNDRLNRSRPLERRVWSATPDGKHRARIGVFRQPEAFGLLGVDLARRQTYWLREGEGGYASFSAIRMDTGDVTPVLPERDLATAFGFVLAPDLRSVFYVDRGRHLVQRPLPQGRSRVLYRLEETGAQETTLHPPTVAPDARSLAFVRSVGERDTTFLLTLPDARATVLSERLRGQDIVFPTSWSPDGRYLWIQTAGDAQTQVLDLRTRRVISIAGEPKQGAPEYRRFPAIRFLAWLAG